MAGPGAKVQEFADRLLGQQLGKRGIDAAIVDELGANPGPVGSVFLKISGDLDRPDLLDAFQARQIRGMGWVVVGQEVDQQSGQLTVRAILVEFVVGPVALLMARQQSGLDQQTQMTRNPRLALAENLDQLTDREFGMGAQPENSEPGCFPRGAQTLQKLFHQNLCIGIMI